jgi:hypothetical protein
MNKEDICVICKQSIEDNAIDPTIWKKGNNAEPVASGQCCDDCAIEVVLVRLRQLYPFDGEQL